MDSLVGWDGERRPPQGGSPRYNKRSQESIVAEARELSVRPWIVALGWISLRLRDCCSSSFRLGARAPKFNSLAGAIQRGRLSRGRRAVAKGSASQGGG